MNRIRIAAAWGAVVVAGLAAGFVAAQPTDPNAPPVSPELKAMMEACEIAAKPGVQHALLKQFEGTWDAKVTMWMPNTPEMVFTGTMVNTMVHGGRYLSHDFKSEFGGEPFSGSGQFGYNNTSKRWEGTWLDSATTGIQFSTGTFDGKKGEWTMTCEFDHPLGYKAKQREVITLAGDHAHRMMMYCTDKDGKEQKVMAIEYTRAGGAAKPGAAADGAAPTRTGAQ
jgi:hypothetical protein